MQVKTYHEHTIKLTPFDAFKANDEVTLRTFYEDNYDKTEKYILNNSGTIEHAKDIYQEAFIAVWRNIQLDKFYPENEQSLAGYLYRIAKNKWLDHLRSGHHKKTMPLADSAEDITDELSSPEDEKYITDVKKQFGQLGKNCQEILTSFYYRKESLRTIAQKLEWTEATARNNKYRCLQRLRELLK
jgi:RNA polymerase sigma factor (sigma-70 family)